MTNHFGHDTLADKITASLRAPSTLSTGSVSYFTAEKKRTGVLTNRSLLLHLQVHRHPLHGSSPDQVSSLDSDKEIVLII